jgi:hypothetical protein
LLGLLDHLFLDKKKWAGHATHEPLHLISILSTLFHLINTEPTPYSLHLFSPSLWSTCMASMPVPCQFVLGIGGSRPCHATLPCTAPLPFPLPCSILFGSPPHDLSSTFISLWSTYCSTTPPLLLLVLGSKEIGRGRTHTHAHDKILQNLAAAHSPRRQHRTTPLLHTPTLLPCSPKQALAPLLSPLPLTLP